MARFIPGGSIEVIAVQYLESDSALDKVNLFDWIHDTDSSTIYGAVSGYIINEITKDGGVSVPFKKGELYIPKKALAMDTDWIIKHGPLDFTVMSDAHFKELYYVKAH